MKNVQNNVFVMLIFFKKNITNMLPKNIAINIKK